MVDDSPVSRRVRTPSWLDLRLVAGIALVLASVVVGVKVVSSAEHTSQYWAASRDLAAGVVLQAGDLHSVSVRLPNRVDGATRYLSVSATFAGQALNREIGSGELVPRAAVGAADAATTVTIPLGGDNAPRITAGQRIAVWVSTKLCPSAVVLADVAVQSVSTSRSGGLGASGGEDVTVRVTPSLAQRVVQALALNGGVLRAGILDGLAVASPALPDLTSCTASGS